MRSFNETLNQKAEEYFASQPSGKYATPIFIAKAVLLVAIYIVTYIHLIFFSHDFAELMMTSALLGLCHVLIPVNISHDAIHQAVSPHAWVNSMCLYGFELTGSNSFMYAKKHLEAHYNKENASKVKAIETQSLLIQRKHSSQTVNLHWILYLFYAQYMIFIRDYNLFREHPERIPSKEYTKLFAFKGLYVFAFLILPFMLIDVAWWSIAAALIFMYFIVTLALVVILLMPTEKMEYSKHDSHNNSDQWTLEVLKNNVDFSPGTPAINLLSGGANMNVVHYLFPSVCHVHYNRMATIIDDLTKQFGMHYRTQRVQDVFGIHYHYLKDIQKTNA